MLLSILSVREVDDNWFNYEVSGSISVNSYGQLKIEEINQKYLTVFVHTIESKLDVVDKIIKSTGIKAVEINVRNKYNDINKLYDNLDFFEIESVEVEKLCH